MPAVFVVAHQLIRTWPVGLPLVALVLGGWLALAAVTAPTADAAAERFPDEVAAHVDLDTHTLFIRCLGSGSPAVIIEEGLGSSAREWRPAQQLLAAHTRVCIYDRAGYGESEPGPLPRTASRIVNGFGRICNVSWPPSARTAPITSISLNRSWRRPRRNCSSTITGSTSPVAASRDR